MKTEAIAKIDEGLASYMGDKYGNAMKLYIIGVLKDFCWQSEEFAQAVVQGGSFSDCMKAVTGKIKGNAISDLDACKAAAEFYFPGCVVEFQMQIHVSEHEETEETEKEPAGGILLHLEDFL